jgi:hypothetical protein
MSFSVDFANLIGNYNSCIDALIDNLGVISTIVFPSLRSDCPNCELNPLSKVSANIYRAGGPNPFTNGMQCPYCEGRGWTESDSTTTFRAMVVYDPKGYWLTSLRGRQTGANIMENMQWRVPDGIIQVVGYLTDLPNIERGNYYLINSAQQGLERNKYKRYGDATIEGLGQNKYFFQFMERMP